uniref:SCAN domain-containing protein n=1 Tax=Globodera rostochiensis TaxID=31243 RepID=A0A914H7V3_GLORO
MEAIGNSSENAKVCVSCHNPSSGAHFCKKCFEPCHAIPPCSISIDGEEGYGAKVVCCECLLRDEVAADENANIVKTAPSIRDKPTTSSSSSSINYEPNIQLLTSEDEEDSTNPPTNESDERLPSRTK